MSVKFFYGIDGKYKKVTAIVNKHFYKDGKYVFKDVYYNSYFGDYFFGAEKHLRIEFDEDLLFKKKK